MAPKKSKAESLLIIFYRNPELGKVKKRLAKTMGDAKAYSIYLLLSDHTKNITEKLPYPKALYYSEYVDLEDSWSNDKFQKYVQTGSNIGEKMANAFRSGFNNGYKSICLIGTDCLELTANILEEAFRRLLTHDVVIGPANDDGYYLLGMNYMYNDVFLNKNWSKNRVLSDLVDTIKLLGLSHWELVKLNDVATEKDLPAYFRS